jgi:superfamily II DNA or RNA helicase
MMTLIIETLYQNTMKQITEAGELLNPAEVLVSWENALSLRAENPDMGIKGLRDPQLGGIYAALARWTYSTEVATIVMPTGTGKTETMLSLFILCKCPKLLVIVPTDPLREQIANKFVVLGLLKVLKVLDENALHPVVGILKKRFSTADEASEFIDRCNVIVTTASLLSRIPNDVFDVLTNKITHIFIDEAHHAEAKTWFDIRDKFKEKKVLQFTATPYRNDGKKSRAEIIYCYPLKKAQQEGYFKTIEFIPIYEYDPKKADKVIAERAVQILRADREYFPHLLLARVETRKRADEVFDIYKQYGEFKVAKIYSGISGKENIKRAIANKEYQIIVCVDMLGEGFDLPELKIAAFHDVKKSLPTTIQFTGRFTRTKYDEKLGSAKIIVNLAGLRTKDSELDELYAQDNDWNELLPRISEGRTEKEKGFHETIAGFNNIEDFIVSLHSLKPAMSTVIYTSNSPSWSPNSLVDALKANGKYELVKSIINNEKKILVAVTAEKSPQKWTDNIDLSDLKWTFYLIHWNETQNLLFIHSSDNESFHGNIAQTIIGEEAHIINGDNKGQVFRCLDGVKRFKLQNVGLIQLLGKLIRFQMSVGTDIERALSRADISRAKKSHVFGIGYEHGDETTIGCSYKGRIWSQIRDDVDVFIKWCEKIGNKILDESIDPEQVLRGAIVPSSVSERPHVFPVCIDWNSHMYQASEDRYVFRIDENEYHFYNSELVLLEPSMNGNVKFGLESDGEIVARFELDIFPVSADDNDFRITKTFPNQPVLIAYGRQEMEIEKYFYQLTPEIWFADGSVLEGCSLSKLKGNMEPYQRERIVNWDWTGIDLSKESQKVNPKITDSIQYRCIEILRRADYDVIYDDDYSGEIADIITVKKNENKISVELYHLKFAKDGRVSTRIENLYEVCGQAQKSLHWKFKEGREFFEHLLRRKVKWLRGEQCPRIQKGDERVLMELLELAKYRLPLEFKIYIVQPSIPKLNATQEQLTLLGVTENYLKDRAQVELVVIGSDKIA